MPEPDQLIQQIDKLIAQQQKLLEGPLTEQVALQYKDLEMQMRELLQRFVDANRRGRQHQPPPARRAP